MKRFIVTAVIASLISGAAFAQETPTNVVSSANIVGYVQTTTPASNKLDIVSLAQFSTGSNSVNIQSIFANMSSLRSGRVITNVDRLITWNGSVYTTYGLYQSNAVGPFWMANGAAWTTPALPKNPANVQLSRGTAAWFQSAPVSTLTNFVASGNVFLDGTYSVKLNGTLMLLSYPYSADININQLVVTNAYAGRSITNVDRIITWNGTVYTTYGLYQSNSVGPFWMANGAAWTTPALPKNPSSAMINLGKGFWYQTVSTGATKTIGFRCSYTNLLQ
jgi:hypothetical protein